MSMMSVSNSVVRFKNPAARNIFFTHSALMPRTDAVLIVE